MEREVGGHVVAGFGNDDRGRCRNWIVGNDRFGLMLGSETKVEGGYGIQGGRFA